MIRIIKAGIFFLNRIYDIFKRFPVRRKVTMISRQSNVPSQEFRMIEEEIRSRGDGTQVILLCRTLDGGIDSGIWTKCTYALHMLVQMYHLATSQVAILDSYCIAVSVLNHKKDLKVIQMWHSMGTMKKFGYTALDTAEGSRREVAEAMHMHQNYDYVFASADAYKEHLAKGFRCEQAKILTMPLPRYDLLKDPKYEKEVRERIYREYPGLPEKPVILYCPTFRKDETQFAKAVGDLIEAVDLERYHLVVKLHPLSETVLPEGVIQAEDFSSFDMLFAADHVISDYSCIIYEAAVRDLPLYFYNFDMQVYQDGRGLAIDYENELPGLISEDAGKIAWAIENGSYDMEELRKFTDKYVEPTEHATAKIVDFVEDLMK